MPTRIQWTINADGSQGETWNCIGGCAKKSAGCKFCYAIRQAHRLAGNPNQKISSRYSGLTVIQNGAINWSGKTFIDEEVLLKPLRTRKPTTYFISLSDLFYDERPTRHIDLVFAVMSMCPQHRFQILSKYADCMLDYMSDPHVAARISTALCLLAIHGVEIPDGPSRTKWPLKNVMLGVSCEDQKHADERIPLLLKTPAAVRFVSLEPLLGPIDLTRISVGFNAFSGQVVRTWDALRGYSTVHDPVFGGGGVAPSRLSWAIAGAESGPGARPAQVEWFRSIKDQCVAAGVPFFLKQYADSKGHKIGTPELDGQQWMQMPEVPCR